MTRLAALAAALLLAAPPSPSLAAAPAGGLDAVRFTGWGRHELGYLDARPHFLTRAELLALPLAPPPANSDAATRADLDELLRLQAARTPAQQQAIERHRQFDGLGADLLGIVGATPASTPRTWALLRHLDRDLTVAVFNAKRRFERARPHQLEPRLRPSLPVPAHPAYPSGHALTGHVLARVLADLVPASRARLVALGAAIGHEREIAGLHYAGDSAASRALGDALLERLLANPRYRAERDAARSEWPDPHPCR